MPNRRTQNTDSRAPETPIKLVRKATLITPVKKAQATPRKLVREATPSVQPLAAPTVPNQSPELDLAPAADLTAMHTLLSNVMEAGKAQEGASAAATTTGTSASALPSPVVAFKDLAHALREESPRKVSASGPAAQEVMSPEGGRRVLEDDDDDDMLISESQEPATEQQDESQNMTLVETEEDEEWEQGLEMQQAAAMNSLEDLHAQSNYAAEITAAASPGTATTTAAAQANGTTSRKRRQYFDERIEWVNMDLVELGIVAVPRTKDTPMLTMEKLWRQMPSNTSMPRKQPPSRAESTTTELGGDSIRAMFLGGSD
jgi:hypothetical protein